MKKLREISKAHNLYKDNIICKDKCNINEIKKLCAEKCLTESELKLILENLKIKYN